MKRNGSRQKDREFGSLGSFYGYTFSKMIKSKSTYVLGAIVMFPLWLCAILILTNKSITELTSTVSAVAFLTFPLVIAFITFKASQVFRDEIEKKTLLSIITKPMSRVVLTLEGYFAIVTMLVLLSVVGIFVPISLTGFKSSIGAFALKKGFLIMLTDILIGSIVASLALLLSLKMKSKSFTGLIIGMFGMGFYILFGFMFFARTGIATGNTLTNIRQDADYIFDNDSSSSPDYEDQKGRYDKYEVVSLIPDPANKNKVIIVPEYASGMFTIDEQHSENKEQIYDFTMTLGTPTLKISIYEIQKLYNDIENDKILVDHKAWVLNKLREIIEKDKNTLNSFIDSFHHISKTYNSLKWFDPSTHWLRMFAATSKNNEDAEDIKSQLFSTKEDVITKYPTLQDPANHIGDDPDRGVMFTFSIGRKDAIPLWYPYLVWIIIGLIIAPLSLRSVARRNIT